MRSGTISTGYSHVMPSQLMAKKVLKMNWNAACMYPALWLPWLANAQNGHRSGHHGGTDEHERTMAGSLDDEDRDERGKEALCAIACSEKLWDVCSVEAHLVVSAIL